MCYLPLYGRRMWGHNHVCQKADLSPRNLSRVSATCTHRVWTYVHTQHRHHFTLHCLGYQLPRELPYNRFRPGKLWTSLWTHIPGHHLPLLYMSFCHLLHLFCFNCGTICLVTPGLRAHNICCGSYQSKRCFFCGLGSIFFGHNSHFGCVSCYIKGVRGQYGLGKTFGLCSFSIRVFTFGVLLYSIKMFYHGSLCVMSTRGIHSLFTNRHGVTFACTRITGLVGTFTIFSCYIFSRGSCVTCTLLSVHSGVHNLNRGHLMISRKRCGFSTLVCGLNTVGPRFFGGLCKFFFGPTLYGDSAGFSRGSSSSAPSHRVAGDFLVPHSLTCFGTSSQLSRELFSLLAPFYSDSLAEFATTDS